MLRYTVTPLPEKHLYEVSLSFAAPALTFDLYVPSWTSGSYLIRDYAGRFRKPEVYCGTLTQKSANRWQWSDLTVDDEITISWQVFAYSEGIHDAYLDDARGFINPAALFLIPETQEEKPVHIAFADKGFEVYSSLKEIEPGLFEARHMQALLDAPFSLISRTADAKLIECEACGISHRLLFTGVSSLNTARLKKDVEAILKATIDFWGSAPFESYLFHIQMGPGLFGGLEHEESSVLQKDNLSLPGEFEEEMPEDYDDFLRLLAHEYFHAWLVKHLRPKALLPYRLESPVHTPDLWVFEGLTSYYENLIPFRAGVIDEATFLKRTGERFRAVREREGFHQESLADASFNAWTHLYKQTADSAYSQSSYYGKGAVLAFILDMAIREKSKGTRSLDDVLRYWFKAALINPARRALPPGGFPALLDEALDLSLAPLAETLSLKTDKDAWESAWEKALHYAGLQIEDAKGDAPLRFLGLFTRTEKNRLLVRYARADGAAFKARLFAGDELLAVDGIRTTPRTFPRQVEAARGRTVAVTLFTHDRLRTVDMTVPRDAQKTIGSLSPLEGTDPADRFKSTN